MSDSASLIAWVQAAAAVAAIVVAVVAIFTAFRVPIAQHKLERVVAQAEGDRIAKFLAVAVQIELREIKPQLARATAHLASAMPPATATVRDTVEWLEKARIEMSPTLFVQVPEFWRLGNEAAGLVQIVGRMQQYNRTIDHSVELASHEAAPATAVTALVAHLTAVSVRVAEAEGLLARWVKADPVPAVSATKPVESGAPRRLPAQP